MQGRGLGRALLTAIEQALGAGGVQLILVRLVPGSSSRAAKDSGADDAPDQEVTISDESDSDAAEMPARAAKVPEKAVGLWQGYTQTGGCLANAVAGMQGLLQQQGAQLMHKHLVWKFE